MLVLLGTGGNCHDGYLLQSAGQERRSALCSVRRPGSSGVGISLPTVLVGSSPGPAGSLKSKSSQVSLQGGLTPAELTRSQAERQLRALRRGAA